MGCKSAADTRTTDDGCDRGTSSWRQVEVSPIGESEDEDSEEEDNEKIITKKVGRRSKSGSTSGRSGPAIR